MRVGDSISLPENPDVTGKLSNTSASKVQGQTNAGFTEDAAEFSPDLQKVQGLKEQLANVPEGRQERVQELRKAVQDGTYEVSPDKIANAMLTDLAGPQQSS